MGDPVELNPWVYDCTIYYDTIYLSAIGIADNMKVSFINPFSEFLKMKLDPLSKIEIQIFNMRGEILFSQVSNSDEIKISSAIWDDGLYILHINCPDFRKTYKVVKISDW